MSDFTAARVPSPYLIAQIPAGERRKVVLSSSLGTVFEWYDFYLYATLAPFFAALFFPSDNETAALLSAFATYAAGFLVRPLGAIIFGRLGDIIGRKYTFLMTILLMGASTFAVGLLPTFQQAGWLAPLILVLLRMAQGLALGGEYGGAAIYVAEHTGSDQRGYATSWIQTTATLGFFLSLVVILICRRYIPADPFAQWGWRIPFLVSLLLLLFSVYMRLRLSESPLFQQLKDAGKGCDAPLTESFLRYPNNKFVLLALLGATAGQAVIWYTGQFYALFFLQITLKVDYEIAYQLIMLALMIGAPFFILFGWLSDRLGRKPIIMLGCLLAVFTYFPIFKALTHTVNPELAAFQQRTDITVVADPERCHFHIFVGPWSDFSDCDRAKDYLIKLGLSFTIEDRPDQPGVIRIDDLPEIPIAGWQQNRVADNVLLALKVNNYPLKAETHQINIPLTVLLLALMVVYVAMVYGPIAAYLVELFPTHIRYTSVSLPYHIGNGWFGGMLPLLATAMVAASGNIYYGLWYPIVIAALTFVIGLLLLPDTGGSDQAEL